MNSPLHRWWPAGLVAAALVAIAFGWPTRLGGYIAGDDERLALNHVLVNHPSLANAAKLLTIIHGDLYQPLPVLSFQLNYALAEPRPESLHGVNLYSFHLTNILLHAANVILVFFVASRLASCRSIGLLTALLFACHPFAVEPIAWISGRTILIATLFSLLLLLGLPLGNLRITPILAWLLALASKVLPTVPIAAIWCDARLHGKIPRRRWTIYGVLLTITAAATYLVYRATRDAGFIDAMDAEPADPVAIRMLLAARHYLENYCWPSRLAGWSPPPLGNTITSTPVLIALAELAALIAIVAFTWRRQRTVCLGLVLFIILIAPFLAASVARRFLAADRYMYLPIVGLHLAVAACAVTLGHAIRERAGRTVETIVTGPPVAALLIAWFWLGWQLGPTWNDNVTRNRRALEVYQDNVLAHVELAKAYVIEKQPNEALATVAKARERWPDHPRLAGVAGEAYRLKKDWSAAAKELRLAADGLPHHLWTLYYLARTLDDLDQSAEARTRYSDILRQHADYLPALIALAKNFENAGDHTAAIETYERAININPYDRAALSSLAVLQISEHHWPRAESLLRSILDLEPDDPFAMLNLGVVLVNTNRGTEALAIYDRLITVDADNLTARLNRAAMLQQLGRTVEAETDYRVVLATESANLNAAIGLHELLQQQHRFKDLLDLWQSVAVADPKQDVRAWLVWAKILAGDVESAQRTAAEIQPTSPDRPFADWAFAFHALRQNRSVEFKQRVSALAPPRPIDSNVNQHAGIIRSGLLDLPAPVRESPAGLFALAHALLYDGQIAQARTALEQLAKTDNADEWIEAANSLLQKLPNPTTQPS